MKDSTAALAPVYCGDVDGMGRVYSENGNLILLPQERLIGQRANCDLAAYGSWRILFPKSIFRSQPGTPSGTLFVTSGRLVFIRNIDVWKQVKPLLTPLGLPAAAEKEAALSKKKSVGARQYCEILLAPVWVIQLRRKSWQMRIRLLSGERRYELFVRSDKDDPGFFDLLEGRLRERNLPIG